MFQPIVSLFEKKEKTLSVRDMRYFIEEYFRSKLKSDNVYCQDVLGGRVIVRVTDPSLQQGVRLLEYDLKGDLKKETGYDLEKIELITR